MSRHYTKLKYDEAMEITMSDQSFFPMFPVCMVIWNADVLQEFRAGHERAGEDVGVHGVVVGDLECLAVFTDEDLLFRHFAPGRLSLRQAMLKINSLQELKSILAQNTGNYSGVVFDPGPDGAAGPHVFTVDEILGWSD